MLGPKKSQGHVSASSASASRSWAFLSCLRKADVWVGFAALLFLQKALFNFEGVLREAPDASRAVELLESQGVLGAVHTPFFLGSTLVAGAVLLLLSSLRGPSASSIPFPRSVRVAAALIIAVVSASLAAVAGSPSEHSSMLFLIGGVAWGVCLAVLLLSWGYVLCSLDLRSALVLASVAACVQWLPLPVALMGSTVVKMIVVVAAALVSLACCERCLADLGLGVSACATCDSVAQESSQRVSANSQAESPEQASPAQVGLLARFGVASFISFAAMQFIWTQCVKSRTGGLWQSDLLLVFFVTVLGSAALFLLVLLAMKRRNLFRIELVYRVAFFATLCAAVSISVAAYSLLLSYALIYVGFSMLVTSEIVLCLVFVHAKHRSPAEAFGVVFGSIMLGQFVGLGAQVVLAAAFPANSAAVSSFGCLACAACLCFAFTFVMPESRVIGLLPSPPAMVPPSIDEKSAAVAAAFGLSPRESDVLPYLARGRNAAHIAEALVVSRNTVATHRRNIYKKLGVHNQQELLSLVENFDQNCPKAN